ncbi:HCN4 [Symbiodinium necroappetens]|uniref:HCN4 protein n=1 Tax=Symbiodinium necroappetens TaxID=1628268 RepID=A0A812WJT8_9DINO|nr:HCN4 [Symbiodinium necroappetens]
MPRKTIIFVRHGESEYNKAMRETGEDPLLRDAKLTERGRAQAAGARPQLQELFEEIGSSAGWLLLSSPLRRALDTAAGIWPEAFQAAEGTRFEIWPELREVVTGCDDLGSTPKQLQFAFPHLHAQLGSLPEVWWTIPPAYQDVPLDGDDLRNAYQKDPDAFEAADEAIFAGRVAQLLEKLASVKEDRIVVVAHCDLIGELTEQMGLTEKKKSGKLRKGWWLSNCECRLLRDFEFKAPEPKPAAARTSLAEPRRTGNGRPGPDVPQKATRKTEVSERSADEAAMHAAAEAAAERALEHDRSTHGKDWWKKLQALHGQVFDALERAERELKTATESLSVVGHQLDTLRAVVQESCLSATALEQRQPEMTRASSTTSRDSSPVRLTLSVADPPGLLLHQHNLQKRKNKQAAQPRFRRVSNVHAAAATGDLRLHGRWMELSTEASQGEAGRERPNKARTAFRSRTATMDDLASANSTGKLPILHPQGLFKLCWDLLALTLLLNDCILLPISLAWDFSMVDDGIGGTITAVSFYTSLVFWTADLPVNLNTAIYIRGRLVMHRRSILWHYSRSWMMFDMFVLSLDYGYLLLSTDVLLLRFVRILRVIRLVRIVKLSKLNTIIEESAASAGRQWVTLVVAITKTAIMMLTTAHFLTCAWFYIGLNLGPELPSLSWVEIAQIAERPETRGLNASSTDDDLSSGWSGQVAHLVPGFIQYMHSLRWIMNSPSPPEMAAGSGVEWGFDILISVTTLVVIGSAISKISGTTAELRAMNEESDRRRRDVRLYLAGQSVSYELVTRIMRFVDYKLEKFSTNTLDASLISPTLQLELYVSQRANYVSRIPIFALLQECYPDVFGSVCAALKKNFFEKGEPVFQAGSYATSLQLTSTGTYSYQEQSSIHSATGQQVRVQ